MIQCANARAVRNSEMFLGTVFIYFTRFILNKSGELELKLVEYIET